MHRIALFISVVAFAATPLAAQQGHQHPAPPPAEARPAPAASAQSPMGMQGGMLMMMMPGMDSMMEPLHALMSYAPRGLLERKSVLQLDRDQESRLSRIAAASQAAHDTAHAAAEHHRHALLEAAGAGSDPAAVVAHFESMHAAMGAAHSVMLRAALESRAVLTAGQRGMVESAAHDMRMHHDESPMPSAMPGHEGHHQMRRP